jgi:endonuclease YncB( thermonuclease family)
MIAAAPFTCHVTAVHDGDTFACADRRNVRLAGVGANELDGSCRNDCASFSALRARRWLTNASLRQRLTCGPVDRSYARVVATCRLPNGRDLSCELISVGAVVRWDRYWRKYALEPCR